MRRDLKKEIWELIQDFYKRYQLYPGTGFLAGYFKVTIEAIRLNLIKLESEGKIKRELQAKNRTEYIIINRAK